MYNDLIRFYGNPSDVPFLDGTEIAPRYCAEYVLHLGFSGAMPEKIGLIIGKNGNGLKKIQEEVNKVYGGAHTIQWEELYSDIPNEEIPSSVQAIWAKNLPDGRIAFTAYGRKPNALCRALQMIRDKAITILKNLNGLFKKDGKCNTQVPDTAIGVRKEARKNEYLLRGTIACGARYLRTLTPLGKTSHRICRI